ncbi:helix-turn-helix domain-containing protein [Kribbella sp. NPDC059898]|uniref:helix-turn-helix domain-containing protein n=1 Tax=Kribbella sp. NPDC059898 TaxID=3346995 RepID=UPI00365495A4
MTNTDDHWQQLAAAAAENPVRAGVHASWVRCEPGWAWQHRLPDFDLWAVTDGTGTARLAGETVPLSSGTVLMLRPGDEVDATQNDRLTVGFVHYTYAHPPDPILLAPRVVRLTEPSTVWDRLRTVISAVHRRDSSGPVQASADLAALLIEVHIQAARARGDLPPPLDPRIRLAVNLVRSRLDQRLTLAEAAAVAQLAPDTFSRLFHTETGQTFRAYCVAARLERARDLLTETALNVSEVARALGYTNYRLFARAGRHRPVRDRRFVARTDHAWKGRHPVRVLGRGGQRDGPRADGPRPQVHVVHEGGPAAAGVGDRRADPARRPLPGSHTEGPVPHFLRRDWQLCDDEVQVARDTVVPLPRGGILFFHGLLHHGTPANRTGTRRRAVQLHYLPAGVVDIAEARRLEIFGSEGKGVSC